MFLVVRRYKFVLALFPLVVKTKGQLLHLTETILHIYINRLSIGRVRSVIQTEFLLHQQIAVVGRKQHAILQTQFPLPIGLEIANRIARVLKPKSVIGPL